jgi:hypothetical protein
MITLKARQLRQSAWHGWLQVIAERRRGGQLARQMMRRRDAEVLEGCFNAWMTYVPRLHGGQWCPGVLFWHACLTGPSAIPLIRHAAFAHMRVALVQRG